MDRNRTSSYVESGRINQKERTRRALLQATRELLDEGQTPTIAQAALRALISEATAYRYYSDAQSLLRDALAINWPGLDATLEQMRNVDDVAVRARMAAEAMAHTVLANEGHVRTLIGIAYSPGSDAGMRPGFRFRLIEAVLEPLKGSFAQADLRRLELALATVVSAEACLTLKDVCKIGDEQIVEVTGWTAFQLVTAFTLRPGEGKEPSK
jgi:AcrR family transcriptional regulator